MHMVKAGVMENIYAHNNHIAEHVRHYLTERNIFAVNVMGAPGTGKTTSLEQLMKYIARKVYVIEGDIESDIDTERLRKQQVKAAQINTFGACHLDAPLVHNAVHTMDFDAPGILFIENVGNLVCPAELDIGEHMKLLIVSVADGSDKPYKYPLAFEKADMILLNKVDLMPYLDFDEAECSAQTLACRHAGRTASRRDSATLTPKSACRKTRKATPLTTSTSLRVRTP